MLRTDDTEHKLHRIELIAALIGGIISRESWGMIRHCLVDRWVYGGVGVHHRRTRRDATISLAGGQGAFTSHRMI